MQTSVTAHLQANPDSANFVRFNPEWYRYLTRNPDNLKELEREAKRFYGKTFTKRLERISNQVQMAGMLIQFADIMKD